MESGLLLYLQLPFVRYALIVGILIALCSSLYGVPIVIRRFSFISDGLSHVAFGAMAVATIMKMTNNLVVILPVTIFSAVILLKSGHETKIKGDAAVAAVSVSALACGYILMNLRPSSTNISGDVCTTLFGATSIMTLSFSDVLICSFLSIMGIVLYILFYNRIFAITFDESFLISAGIRTDLYNLFIAVITAVIIVLAMNLVGSLLISALIIFPAVSSMKLFNSFKKVTISSAIISVLCALTGIIIAVLAGTPVGSTIVACNICIYIIFLFCKKMKGIIGI